MLITKMVIANYANHFVLILNEWLLLKPTDEEQLDIYQKPVECYYPVMLMPYVAKHIWNWGTFDYSPHVLVF